MESIYKKHARIALIKDDPVEFPHRYERPEDIEVVSLIASSFSYGQVAQFKKAIEKILAVLGESPHAALMKMDAVVFLKKLDGVYYRFNRPEDIAGYLLLISEALKKHGTLGKLFMSLPGDTSAERLSAFVAALLSADTAPVYGKNRKPGGLRQLLPDPKSGTACKRMHMFLRWMVRRDEIDFGLWSEFGAERLLIPLDTHVARFSKRVGLTGRNATDHKTALDVTGAFLILNPSDPIKYDFALAHRGISGECGAEADPKNCLNCEFNKVCKDAGSSRR